MSLTNSEILDYIMSGDSEECIRILTESEGLAVDVAQRKVARAQDIKMNRLTRGTSAERGMMEDVPYLHRFYDRDVNAEATFVDGKWLIDIDSGKSSGVISVEKYGAVGDARWCRFGSISSGSKRFNCDYVNIFDSSCEGKQIAIEGAGVGGDFLVTTIASYIDPNNVELADAAGTTVNDLHFCFGTDDSAAFQAAMTDAMNSTYGTMRVFVPSGKHYMANFILPSACQLIGGGAGTRWRPMTGAQHSLDDKGVIIFPADPNEPVVDVPELTIADESVNNQLIEGIRFQGLSSSKGAPCIRLEYLGEGSAVFNGAEFTLYKCAINTFSVGVRDDSPVMTKIDSNCIMYCGIGVDCTGEAPSLTVINNSISGKAKDNTLTIGVRVENAVECSIISNEIILSHHSVVGVNCPIRIEGLNIEHNQAYDTSVSLGNACMIFTNCHVKLNGVKHMGTSGESQDTPLVRYAMLDNYQDKNSGSLTAENIYLKYINDDPLTGGKWFAETKPASLDGYWQWPAIVGDAYAGNLSVRRYSDSNYSVLEEAVTAGWLNRDVPGIGYSDFELERMREHFFGSGVASGSIGAHGWYNSQGAVEIPTGQGSSYRIKTGVSTNAIGNLLMYPYQGGVSRKRWELSARFKLASKENVELYLGLINGPSTAPPTNFVGMKLDTNDDDNFKFVAGASVADSGRGASIVKWHTLRVRKMVEDKFRFSLDGGAEIEIDGSAVAGSMGPGMVLQTLEAAEKAILVDFISFDQMVD